MELNNLYDYIFWFNPYENLWYAIERETQLEFFNGDRDKSKFLKSKEHSTLVALIVKEGLIEKINQS